MKSRTLVALAFGVTAVGSCAPPDGGSPDLESRAFLRVVAAEDARPAGGRDLDVLLAGSRHARPRIRAAAVRGLGRLERPAVLGHILPLLSDEDPTVRMEAANAAAQAVYRGSGEEVLPALLRRVEAEETPSVLAVVARSLGRLSLDGSGRRQAAAALVALSRGEDGDFAPEAQLEGVALGMESWVRGRPPTPRPPALQARLRAMADYRRGTPSPESSGAARRIRTVALLAYGGAGLTPEEMDHFLSDPESAPRRAAAAHLGALPPAERLARVDRALADPSPQVRLEAARTLGRAPLDGGACRRLVGLSGSDPDTGVRLVALDALALPCPGPASVALLEQTATSLADGADGAWHAPAHALVSLAARAPGRAAALLPPFVGHPNPFVRAYGARAAALTGAGDALRALTTDADANVRAAALAGLAAVEARDADPILVEATGTDDAPQVLLTGATALAGTALRAEALDAALATVERLGQRRAETLRDPRVALLDLAESVGSAEDAGRLEPFLRDFDAAVAERAAQALQAWTGKRYLAAPREVQSLPLPEAENLRAMEEASLVLHMARGGDIRIHLRPREAPTSAFRLFTMVRAGALDGLTFHRVVPNFVIQGGSPGANEYAGHGAFTRDEVGLDVQWRGTVGVSTRGRDTGDGQIYVNLVDNVRLDHDYTLLGVITAGMEVADAVLEGDVIRSAEWMPGG